MKEIAVATLSGRAYYELVSELKRRGIDFLSVTPGDDIPSYIKVVITTDEEADKVPHSNILVYRGNAKEVVEEIQKILCKEAEYTAEVDFSALTFELFEGGKLKQTVHFPNAESLVDHLLKEGIKYRGGLSVLLKGLMDLPQRLLKKILEQRKFRVKIINEGQER